MDLSEYLACCLNILLETQCAEGYLPADRQSRLLLYGCYQTAHHDFLQLTARYLHTLPPVAMVIEAGVSSDGRSTDIRAALKLKHQTSTGGGDLLSLCSKSIWTITSLWACNGSNTLNWLRKPSLSSLWCSYYIPPCMKGWMKGQTIIWIKDTGVGWKWSSPSYLEHIMFMHRVSHNLLLNNWLLQC